MTTNAIFYLFQAAQSYKFRTACNKVSCSTNMTHMDFCSAYMFKTALSLNSPGHYHISCLL